MKNDFSRACWLIAIGTGAFTTVGMVGMFRDWFPSCQTGLGQVVMLTMAGFVLSIMLIIMTGKRNPRRGP